MSNLAVGIALGAAMNSSSNYSSSGEIYMPPLVAIICVVTLAICIIVTVVKLYRDDSCLLESHWERLIFGPVMGMCIWGSIACVVGLFGFLLSFLF